MMFEWFLDLSFTCEMIIAWAMIGLGAFLFNAKHIFAHGILNALFFFPFYLMGGPVSFVFNAIAKDTII